MYVSLHMAICNRLSASSHPNSVHLTDATGQLWNSFLVSTFHLMIKITSKEHETICRICRKKHWLNQLEPFPIELLDRSIYMFFFFSFIHGNPMQEN